MMNQRIKNPDLESNQADPRIDSPNIKVVYPSSVESESEQKTFEQNEQQLKEKQEVKNEVVQNEVPKEPHSCKLSFQDAIKQHSTGFILLGLGILAFGFIIGKNKV